MCVTMVFARLDWSPLKPSQGVTVLLQNYLRILGRVRPRPTVHLCRWGPARPRTHRYAKYTYATFIRDFRTCELLSRDFHPTIESRSWWSRSV